jgi:hypothetical protein
LGFFSFKRGYSMASNIVFNGVTYSIPVTADDGWGPDLTAYFISIATNALQKTGGSFTLTSEIDFGATYGLKSSYLKSQAANPSGTGAIRLGNAESVSWRNFANSADLSLSVDVSNALNFNGTAISIGGAPVQTAITVTDTATIDMTLSILNDLSAIVVAGSLTNTHINAAAAIAYSKLNLSTSIVNADISASAGIIYSKLSISAGDIAYSKLTLSNSILNADIAAAAGIAVSKLAALTASRALVSDSSGFMSASAVTSTELGYLSGVTSAIQTQLNATRPIATGGTGQTTKTLAFDALSPNTTKGDVTIFDGTNNVRFSVGSNGQVPSADSTQASGWKWIAPLTNPMTTVADIIVGGASGAATRLAAGANGTLLQMVAGAQAWAALPIYVFNVQDQKTAGTDGGTSSAGVNTRALNYSQANTISGASVASNQVTLPAGTYDVVGRAPAFGSNHTKAYLYNVTDSALALPGDSAYNAGSSVVVWSHVSGRITIASSKVFELRQYFETGVATNGLGTGSASGQVEVYSTLQFTKVG